MAAIVSVHIADVGVGRALRLLARKPKPGQVSGLVEANAGLCAQLSDAVLPTPSLRRVALFSFWEDERSLDGFVRTHAEARALAGGWHARLEPLRIYGAWPGIPTELPKSRRTDYGGPAVVLTLAKTRMSQIRRFLKTTAPAAAAVLGAPGNVWGTGCASPPFFATCSLWESAEAVSAYAYGPAEQRHADAIAEARARPFHKREAFIRFRPLHIEGSLAGKNPLPATALSGIG